ncbi:MAG: hypothetical protein DI598_04125 [Pseudopedobacter saltans]|uniref:Uncharacterized protein n=1 Tax=Pseudopedobacter saltans TaxID=151895 RepID=A0A2W5F4L9_9SPHI|nr:MAG: hypothetical protein DI598_04125 [Pseudopedobacter saltans]
MLKKLYHLFSRLGIFILLCSTWSSYTLAQAPSGSLDTLSIESVVKSINSTAMMIVVDSILKNENKNDACLITSIIYIGDEACIDSIVIVNRNVGAQIKNKLVSDILGMVKGKKVEDKYRGKMLVSKAVIYIAEFNGNEDRLIDNFKVNINADDIFKIAKIEKDKNTVILPIKDMMYYISSPVR